MCGGRWFIVFSGNVLRDGRIRKAIFELGFDVGEGVIFLSFVSFV